jgi:hypothetical protein
MTFPQGGADPEALARALMHTADLLSRRLSGR